MEITANGLSSLLLPGADRGRSARSQTDSQARPKNQNEDRSNNQSRQVDTRDEARLQADATRSSVITNSRDVSSTQRTLSERDSSFNQSATRQFSVPAAIQTFKDNEALIAPEGGERQVSGIIDEFV